MKIVMVGDQCNVGYELGEELKRRGHHVEIWQFEQKKASTLRMIKRLRNCDFDIVHAHYLHSPGIAAFFCGLPFVMHCHGSDVRNGVSWWKREILGAASHVLLSTPDLLKALPKAEWLPNPAGPQFQPLGLPRKDCAVYFERDDEPVPKLEGYKVEVLPRKFTYEEMPKVLNQYAFAVDDHYGMLVDGLNFFSSKTMIEAAACGCKILKYDGSKMWTELPAEHRIENVVDRLIEVYKDVM